jgi:predicted acetyltransferase
VARLVTNMLELYMHDLSEAFPMDLGPDGRFGYDLLRYWQEPETRFPFLIRADGQLAGFAFVARGSPATDDASDLDVAEFFVLRRYRRSGVGRQAAFQLWDRMPGRWIVRVSDRNHRGQPFWRAIIAEYSAGDFSERALPAATHVWSVFTLRSRQ